MLFADLRGKRDLVVSGVFRARQQRERTMESDSAVGHSAGDFQGLIAGDVLFPVFGFGLMDDDLLIIGFDAGDAGSVNAWLGIVCSQTDRQMLPGDALNSPQDGGLARDGGDEI